MKSKGKNILITGGSGFIGGHLTRNLMSEGYSVTILDLIPPAKDLTPTRFVQKDVNDADGFTDELMNKNWDAIFHFAAIVSVPECEKKPAESFATNSVSTYTALQALLRRKQASLPVPMFFFASSAAVYGNLGQKGKRLKESDPLPEPLSFYGLHKYLSEQSVRLFSKRFGIPSLTFRFFNVYGPGQKKDSPYSGVISKFHSAFETGQEVSLFNQGLNERDFIHVFDIASACTRALSLDPERLDGGPINLATGKSITIKDTFELMSKNYGKRVPYRLEDSRPGDIPFSCGDASLAEALLDWKARPFNGQI